MREKLKLLLFLVSLLTCVTIVAQTQQRVTTNFSSSKIFVGQTSYLTATYKASGDAKLTGLGLRLHFDSSELEMASSTDRLTEDSQSFEIKDDTANYDNDTNTDKYFLTTWVDTSADGWPSTAAQPTTLYKVPLTALSGFDGSKINLTASSTAPGYIFSANSNLASMDIDGNGYYEPLTDGLLVLRYMFGLSGDALIAGVVASDATRTTSAEIGSYIQSFPGSLDVDGNGTIDALTDGLLTLRYLFGLEGDTLIAGAVASGATRTSVDQVDGHLGSLTSMNELKLATTNSFPEQTVSASVSSQIGVGQTTILTVTYKAAGDAKLPGLGLRLHFDSSELKMGNYTDRLQDSALPFQIKDDLANYDNDATTDKYFSTSWADTSGDGWPNDSTQPATLYKVPLTALSDFDGANINFTASGTAAGYRFSGSAVTLILDTDGDGIGDSVDAFPNDASETVDSDSDGVGDNSDAFPLDATETIDTDSDGIGNNADTDDDNDGVSDGDDAFPLDATETVDTDSDGTGNNADTDDDGDSVIDTADEYPLISLNGLTDTDGDGIPNDCDDACIGLGMIADVDDDGDLVIDVNDAFPLDAAETIDTDSDGAGNNADTDDDGDGILDVNDAFPLDATESIDTDSDGTGNNADTDDDGDGIADSGDTYPLISLNGLTDTDGDGWPDDCDSSCVSSGLSADPDNDNDGTADQFDAFPLDSTEIKDTDSDGVGDNADSDDDNDGTPDSQDLFPLINYKTVLLDSDLSTAPFGVVGFAPSAVEDPSILLGFSGFSFSLSGLGYYLESGRSTSLGVWSKVGLGYSLTETEDSRLSFPSLDFDKSAGTVNGSGTEYTNINWSEAGNSPSGQYSVIYRTTHNFAVIEKGADTWKLAFQSVTREFATNEDYIVAIDTSKPILTRASSIGTVTILSPDRQIPAFVSSELVGVWMIGGINEDDLTLAPRCKDENNNSATCADLVTLNADGTGSTLMSERPINWIVLSDGSLRLSFTDNNTVFSVRQIEKDKETTSVLVSGVANGKYFARTQLMVKQQTTAPQTSDLLLGKTLASGFYVTNPSYLRSTVDNRLIQFFGFVLNTNITSYFAVAETTSGNVYDVNLSQIMAIVPDSVYTITFKAKSSIERTIIAGVGLNSGSYANSAESVSLTTEWQTFTLSQTSTGFGDDSSRVLFDMGGDQGGQVWLDDVSVKTADGKELVTNGDFQAGETGWAGNAAVAANITVNHNPSGTGIRIATSDSTTQVDGASVITNVTVVPRYIGWSYSADNGGTLESELCYYLADYTVPDEDDIDSDSWNKCRFLQTRTWDIVRVTSSRMYVLETLRMDEDRNSDGVREFNHYITSRPNFYEIRTYDVNDVDGDGVANDIDLLPVDAADWVDFDSDGVGDNADADDDNDGVIDSADTFPFNASETIDTDSDGIGNTADSDDDNDGVSDVWTTEQLGSDIDAQITDGLTDAVVGRSSLSHDGKVLAVGAFGTNNYAGRVRIFEWNTVSQDWIQRGNPIEGVNQGDYTGYSISLSSDGSVVAIDSSGADPNGSESGYIRVYAWDGQNWAQRGANIDGESAGDMCCYLSISADGASVVVGAQRSSGSNNLTDSGQTRVFTWDGQSWVKKGLSIDGEAALDRSGRWATKLSADGLTLAIGARLNDGNGTDSGHTRVYKWIDGAWSQRGQDIDGEAAGDLSGNSVSLSSDGSLVAIGAPGNDGAGDGAGHVRVYSWSEAGSNWIQRGQDINGEVATCVEDATYSDTDGDEVTDTCGDESGWASQLSADGSTLAIGAWKNDGTGESAGHTRLYGWDIASQLWVQRAADIDGEAAGDHSGYQTSISSDGSIVAIGAWGNIGSGSGGGHVRVYRLSAPLDAFPLDATETLDTDLDGIGNNADTDDDGDLVTDGSDGYPLISLNGLTDTDGDGIPDVCDNSCLVSGMNEDEDKDGDGVLDIWSAVQLGEDIDGEAAGDLSGSSIGMSADGRTIVIGAELNDGNGVDAGHLRVFDMNDGVWAQRGEDIDGISKGDNSGSVSIADDGNMIAVGAYNHNSGGGLLRVYEWKDSAWVQRGIDIFDKEDEEPRGSFSRTLSLSPDGSTVAVSNYLSTENGLIYVGRVDVYRWDGLRWISQDSIFGDEILDLAGLRLALSYDGQSIAIGTLKIGISSDYSGYVRIYTANGASWTQKGDDLKGEIGDRLYHVDFSRDGNIVAVGANASDRNGIDSGYVAVYSWDGQGWIQRGSIITGETAGDFATNPRLSDDGNIVAVSSSKNDGIGIDSGHVRLYVWDNNLQEWTRRGNAIDGEASGDQSGASVSMSSDGSVIAIGAAYNDGNGEDSGHTRIYSMIPPTDVFPMDASETIDTDSDGIGNNSDTDDDGDSVIDTADEYPLISLNGLTDTDGDGIPNNCNDACSVLGMIADADDDNDTVLDVDDAFPLDATEIIDTDSDGTGNNADTDDDNDTVLDVDDAFPLDATETIDTDSDGTGNNADTDDDNDTVLDVDDAFPLDATETTDTDSDGTGNNADTDDDNDTVLDVDDAFPLDATEIIDTDSDGTGNNADTDDDNDTVLDVDDAFPLDATETIDTDSDGTGNNADTDDDGDGVEDSRDTYPLISLNGLTDTDGDGIPNNCDSVCSSRGMIADADDDNDTVLDLDDAFPLDATETIDTDSDGTGNNADNDDDGDTVLDVNDAFPLDASETLDTDSDGTGNNADTDDDNDSVLDSEDAFPLDGAESVDTDSDGIGNNADTDDDNDGVSDSQEAVDGTDPLDAASTDTDSDGILDSADADDDGDGVVDSQDAFPLDSSETLDSDSDGIGDNADLDDDNDGVDDINDSFPFDATESLDTDSDGLGNNADDDDDGDGVIDENDAFPLDASESIDTDGDGMGNNSDPDDDGDGLNDEFDAFPLDINEYLDSDSDGMGDNSDAFPDNAEYTLDSDNDGMPDAWEIKYGLNPNDASDASSDQDNDGVSALDEFLTGTIPSGSLDIDGNGQYDALTDGLLLLRGMFGLDGSALVTGTIASDAAYTESVDIESRIATLGVLADIDGNGTIDALTDGLLTLRYLFGLEGETLTAGVVASDATRVTAVEIEAHLKTLMPAI